MPVTTSYPGIYIQEAPSTSHTIVAAPTNIAVFIGYTHPLKTPAANLNTAVQIFSFSDYQAQFGGFVRSGAFANAYGINISPPNPGAFGDMAQAVSQFFLNGGTNAYVVSLRNDTLTGLPLSALWLTQGSPPGTWELELAPTGQTAPDTAVVFTATEVTDEKFAMLVTIRPGQITSPLTEQVADIIITYGPAPPPAGSPPGSPPSTPVISGPGTTIETYRRVSLNPLMPDGRTPNPNYIVNRLSASVLVSVKVARPNASPQAVWPLNPVPTLFPNYLPESTQFYSLHDYVAVLQEDTDLDKVPVFNLMVLPGIANNSAKWNGDPSGAIILGEAIAFCERKMAFLIMDPPIADSADGTVPPNSNPIQSSVNNGLIPDSKNAAIYFPYLLTPDPITGAATNSVTGQPNQIPPAAPVAGIFAATDGSRGVWKAPAGFQAQFNASVTGVVPSGRMTDQRQGVLNPLGVNCLRQFPNIGTVVFGSRTTATLTDEQWRYVPVRRMALFLEQTFYANLKWVVFEPNDEPLWSAITMSITAFMLGLFKQGAFQGDTPSKAFLVQCNSQTTTQTDINNGVVNIIVGFAPLKPAEFVIITLTQLAGQTQTA
jgi:phage tail sheath protein FI